MPKRDRVVSKMLFQFYFHELIAIWALIICHNNTWQSNACHIAFFLSINRSKLIQAIASLQAIPLYSLYFNFALFGSSQLTHYYFSLALSTINLYVEAFSRLNFSRNNGCQSVSVLTTSQMDGNSNCYDKHVRKREQPIFPYTLRRHQWCFKYFTSQQHFVIVNLSDAFVSESMSRIAKHSYWLVFKT